MADLLSQEENTFFLLSRVILVSVMALWNQGNSVGIQHAS